jgi:thiosulfate/3-mercaptopyruvate sulfurtransferase
MQRKGVSRDAHVVLHSAGDGTHAAYAYWLLRYYGHPSVSLLDGGVRAWTDAGLPLQTRVPPTPEVGPYESPGPDRSVRVDRDEVLADYVHSPGGRLLLDCRTAPEYRGTGRHLLDLPVEQHRVAGHIPGARNLPSGALLDRGRFRPLGQVRGLVATSGVRAGLDVAVYCRVAERSALLWFALHELLGHRQVRHYDGGWTEWGSLLDVPVERD